MQFLPAPVRGLSGRLDSPVAAVIAGLIAGAAYLGAQLSFSAALHGSAWEPLQRIAAILMGPDAAPPPVELSPTIAGMALLIHFGLAAVFGRLVEQAVRGRAPAAAAGIGAVAGLALFAFNYYGLAPLAFPWFEDGRTLTTAVDHLLFGAIAGLGYAVLAMRR